LLAVAEDLTDVPTTPFNHVRGWYVLLRPLNSCLQFNYLWKLSLLPLPNDTAKAPVEYRHNNIACPGRQPSQRTQERSASTAGAMQPCCCVPALMMCIQECQLNLQLVTCSKVRIYRYAVSCLRGQPILYAESSCQALGQKGLHRLSLNQSRYLHRGWCHLHPVKPNTRELHR